MSNGPDRESDTVGLRLQKYDRFLKLDAYLAGGLGGLALFGDLAKDAFHDAPDWVRGGFITFVVLTGLSIGSAWNKFLWAQTLLERKLIPSDLKDRADDPIAQVAPDSWPRRAFRWQKAAPILLALTAIWLLVAAWWTNGVIRHWIALIVRWFGAPSNRPWVVLLVLIAICGGVLWWRRQRRSDRRNGDGDAWVCRHPAAQTVTEKRQRTLLVATQRAQQIAAETYPALGPFKVLSQSLSETAALADACAMVVMRASDGSIISVQIWTGGVRHTINRPELPVPATKSCAETSSHRAPAAPVGTET
jgi:hypothetical protein